MTPETAPVEQVEDLKPCPFCGKDNVKVFGPYGWYRHYGINHGCSPFYNGTSEMMQGFARASDAIAAWNRRATFPPLEAASVDREAISRAADYVLRNSRKGTSLNDEQRAADDDKLLVAYRDIISKALASGFLPTVPANAHEAQGVKAVDETARDLLFSIDRIFGKPTLTGPMAQEAYEAIRAALTAARAQPAGVSEGEIVERELRRCLHLCERIRDGSEHSHNMSADYRRGFEVGAKGCVVAIHGAISAAAIRAQVR